MNSNTRQATRRTLLGALAAVPLIPLPVLAGDPPYRAGRPLMGTWVDITVAEGRGAAQAVDEAFAHMARLAASMSRFDPDSRLSALNRAAGTRPVAVPPMLMDVLQQARAVHRRTAGAFDATIGRLTPTAPVAGKSPVPDDSAVRSALAHVGTHHMQLDPKRGTAFLDDPMTQLDLGGIAKLPILEAGLDALRANGVRGALVNGGGDVLATARRDGRAWRIGVRDPSAPDRLLTIVALRAGVVASSGDYERYVMHEGRPYHHVIDPATGRPTHGIHGVTLVADRVAEVNGLGTATMVAGPANAAALLARCGIARALFVRERGAVWISPDLTALLEDAPGRGPLRASA